MRSSTDLFTLCGALMLVGTLLGARAPVHARSAPRLRIMPGEVTIPPGASTALRLEKAEGGNDWVPIGARWNTTSSSVVTVDSLTGVVTGRTRGDATVSARREDDDAATPDLISATVHVR